MEDVSSLVVIDRSGQEHVLEAGTGRTVMEIIRDGGLDELLALCGGCLSCATCHVHADADFLALLPAMSDDEKDLLDSSDHRSERSRLSCQIPMTESLSGLRVTIAPED
jgi:ferredoxin, 2Fe-2S